MEDRTGRRNKRTSLTLVLVVLSLACLVFATAGRASVTKVVSGVTCDLGQGTCIPDSALWRGCADDLPNTSCQVLQSGDNNRTLDMRFNYALPAGAMEKTWVVTAQNTSWRSNRTTFHIALPANCLSQPVVQLRYVDWSFMHQGACLGAGSNYSCYNGTSWQLLNNASIGLGTPSRPDVLEGDAFCTSPSHGVLYTEDLQ